MAVLQGTAGNDYLAGGNDADELYGYDGNDGLNGAGGDDIAYGGLGNDSYYLSAATDIVVELADEGVDTVYVSFNYTLTDNVENAHSSGPAAVTGNAQDNHITGNASFDKLIGLGGNDILDGVYGASDQLYGGDGDDLLFANYIQSGGLILDGGSGNDTVSFDHVNAYPVKVDLKLTGYQSNGIYAGVNKLTGIENVIGSRDDDTLVGNAVGNRLMGAAGDDVLDGDGGDDFLDGGAGADRASYLNATGPVVVDLVAGTGTGANGTDTLVSIEGANGSAFADQLLGNDGDNIFFGGAGNDLIDGGGGMDIADFYDASVAGGVTVDLRIAGVAQATGQGNDILIGIEGAIGTDYADVLIGDGQDNVFDGRSGVDSIDGGDGNDIVIGHMSHSELTGGAGYDTLDFSAVGYTGVEGIATINIATGSTSNYGHGDSFSGFERIVGTQFGDTITGDDNANVIAGGNGNDVIHAAGGDDILQVIWDDYDYNHPNTDSYDGGAGIDTLDLSLMTLLWSSTVDLRIAGPQIVDNIDTTIVGIENLIGNRGDDVLIGDGGANRIEGGAGNDSLDGGLGIDTVSYEHAAAGVTLSLALTGPQATGGAGTDTLAGFENIVGSAFADVLDGDGGDNLIDGGAGIDTARYASAAAGVIVSLGVAGAQATGGAGSDTLVGVENLTGSAYDDQLAGTDGDNVLAGGAGIDTLSYAAAAAGVTVSLAASGAQATGGGGVDTLSGFENFVGSAFDDVLEGSLSDNRIDGGAGNDVVSLAAGTSAMTLDLAAGTPTGGGLGTDVLISIEGAIGSAFADRLTGTAGANRLDGGAGDDQLAGSDGNDLLAGGAGNDRLDGGYGIDTANYGDAAAGVTINLVSQSAQNSGGAGVDTLIRVENLAGSAFADVLTGNDLANALSGGGGNDLLSGGAGNDVLAGGDGIDTASYATAGGAVRVSLAILTAQSTLAAGADTLSGIENLTGSAHDDQLTGDGGNNALTGNAGNDVLIGGLGNDVLSGGAGVDTTSYANAAAAVTVSLALTTAQDSGGGGIDTLLSIENLTGSAFDDVLTGSAQLNVLSGGLGNDLIDGGSAADTIDGSNGNDRLKGSAGDDVIGGGAGLDILTGGAGADQLTGGTGVDRFAYLLASDSTVAATDRILDFAAGDILDLAAVDANSKVTGDQAFQQVAAFTGAAGQLTLAFDAGSNMTTLFADTNGDAVADMSMVFTGDVTVLTAGWVL